MFYGLDPLYFMILGPSLLLAAWASWNVHRATLTSVLTLAYYLLRAGVFGSQDRDEV